MITVDEIDRVYNELGDAEIRMHAAGENEIEAKATLDTRRLSALADGKIAGKNADEREAAARQLLAPEYAALATAEFKARLAHLQVELSRLAVERTRARLRLAELTFVVENEILPVEISTQADPDEEKMPF